LINSQIDVPHIRFLKEDRADLTRLAERLQEDGSFLGEIRIVPEGTIIFANEPFCDVTGPLWNIQLYEVIFEHAFDVPMTVGYRAMEMRRAAGPESFLSVFSLRRDGDSQRSIRVSRAAYISGFNDTSDMEAAFQLGIGSVGTMAHYLVQSFVEYNIHPEFDSVGGKKHPERVAFERWLDDNPNGTVLLIDTYGYKKGIVHAIQAGLSSEQRRKAFKGIRIDSGDLIESSKYCRETLDLNGLKNVGIFLTSDLDAKKIKQIKEALDFPIWGYGIGTKLAAEVESVAGIIFKESMIAGIPILKCSGTPGKETLPGEFQVWRCVDAEGNYVKDIITLIEEPEPRGEDFVSAIPLLQTFWGKGTGIYKNRSTENLKRFIKLQLTKFKVPLEKYPVVLSPKLAVMKQEIAEKIKDKNPEGIKIPED
jgi:nicotinate phosphoribosyltransferase